MNALAPVIAVTSGEPAGVGPELCAMLAREAFQARIVLLGDEHLLAERAALLNLCDSPGRYRGNGAPAHAGLEIEHVPLAVASRAGQLDSANGRYVVALLDRAAEGCLSGEFDAMVTAPVHKAAINGSGVPFTGHTEYLAARAGLGHVVMMLVGGGMRVALATTHVPLAQVPAAITRELVLDTLRIIDRELRAGFALPQPRILVAGLNPHAGESGLLGGEDAERIAPAIAAARDEGISAEGPLPADTLFVPDKLARADCVLAMYHDQGLPVLKHASFGGGVNVTLGLPFVRTSVDHGTALDLAGYGSADPGSLFEAVRLALELVRARRRPR